MRTIALIGVTICFIMTALLIFGAIYFAWKQEWRMATRGVLLAAVMATQIFVGLRILWRHPRVKPIAK